MTSDDNPPPVRHEFVTDEDYVRRLQATAVRYSVTRPAVVAYLLLVVITAIGFFVLSLWNPDLRIYAAGGLLLGATLLAMLAVIARRRIRLTVPTGARYAATVTPDYLQLETPFASSEIKYSAYVRVDERDDFVILHHRGGPIYMTLPIQLFPAPLFERLRSLIAKAQP